MGYTGNYSTTINIAGKSHHAEQTVISENIFGYSPLNFPVAKTGVIHTRTDGDTCVLTMQAAHGIASTNKVDVYWSGGCRLGMTATVATNEVTVDGGTGDVLPLVGVAVTVQIPVVETFVIDGSTIVGFAFSCDSIATLRVYLTDGTTVSFTITIDAGGLFKWSGYDGIDIPVGEGVFSKISISTASSSATPNPLLSVQYN